MAAPGGLIAHYRLIRRIGAGGMGEVFLAHDLQSGRPVAIKLLAALAGQADYVNRLREEARIQARLFHPNLVTLLELVETNAGPCLVMEYVDGPSLREWMEQVGTTAWRDKLGLVAAVARGVAFLHTRDIVHRDIKPDNIRLAGDGTPKLLDFGIARDRHGPRLTRTGQIVGTLHYMAPEQLAGAAPSPRTDVWALGVLLYELLVGHPPFSGESESEIISRVRAARFVAAGTLTAGLPPGVDQLLRSCLQAKPERRPSDAGAVAVALDDLGRDAMELPAPSEISHPWWNRRAWAAASVLLVGLGLIGGTFMLPGDEDAMPQASVASRESKPPFERKVLTVEGLGHSYDVYQGAAYLGQTPLRFEAELGSEVALDCRRDGNTVYRLIFTVGLRNSYPCRN